MALGALRSPTPSLCAEAGVPPIHYLFLSLTVYFLASTVQYSNLPFFSNALCPQNSLLPSLPPT